MRAQFPGLAGGSDDAGSPLRTFPTREGTPPARCLGIRPSLRLPKPYGASCSRGRVAVRRALVPLLLVIVLPAFAGCNVKDWYNQNGTVEIDMKPMGTSNTSLGDFRVLKIAVYDVTAKQIDSANPQSFSFTSGGQAPLIVDLVGKAGQAIPLASFHTNLRAIESVTIHIDVVEAVDAAGKSLPGCHPGQPVVSKPCVATPADLGYRAAEKSFSPPRGGKVVFGFPLAVRAGGGEYFIQYDPTQATIDRQS